VSEALPNDAIAWHLLDNDPGMLLFAKSNEFAAANVSYHCLDILAPNEPPIECQLGFLAYTFLDFELNTLAIKNISSWISPGGHLLLFVPDVLEDVIEAAQSRPALLHDYRRGHASINKLDKFTHSNVLFEANRIEYILELFTSSGFALTMLSKRQFGDVRYHFMLDLWKLAY